ncbi:chromosomal replication initiator protein DnaA [Anaerotalea alkaliphila]|uniref:Chromosomal replication initiator protein DnaA n=1 Tax=Anaerotalea alkaliphila TaxID=2662126 RepID=A0A7X5HWU4_9FIRM|nr:chromosomal replication initiator protein DnaA [Anaerotalea alkaliphila]NDL68091.1 chromosomal replication initiator protein DnaA [Anaerotalea alkaliphila]
MHHAVIDKWNQVLDLLQHESDINKITYKAFLEKLVPIKVVDDVVVIKADDEVSISIIQKKYLKTIMVAIHEIIGETLEIKFVLEDEPDEETGQRQSDKGKKKGKATPVDGVNEENNLNARYTFDKFVVGNNNKFANAAALAVAEAPAEAYNPLFIYGGVGLGKTHLMHSIAHFILNENNDMKVLYVSSEKFTNELINSIRSDKNEEFRQKYRNIDVLLVDDIQFIAGKERTQEEFFHTFNTLYEAKKQIIISSDRPPKEIETLEERLRSRFEWGLIADIQAPDFETRMAILKNKAEIENLQFPDDVLQYVASNIKSNIRELEGAVNKIVAYSKLIHLGYDMITREIAEVALKDLISPQDTDKITPELILDMVAEHFGISFADITSKKRPREISNPRQIAMYLCRKLTDASLPKIGELIGKRDHTTILHGYEKINADLKVDASLRNTIDILTKKITGK